MITPDQALVALRQAKPAPMAPMTDRPSATTALHEGRTAAEVELVRPLRLDRHRIPVSTRRGILTAVIAFAVVAIVGWFEPC